MGVRSPRLIALGAVALLLVTGTAQADDLQDLQDQLRGAQQNRERIEQRIGEATRAFDRLETRTAELERERDELDAELEVLRDDLAELDELVSFRVRETFKHGQSLDPIAVFLATDDPNAALSKAETVQRVVSADQARSEDLDAARTAVAATEQRLADRAQELERTRAEQRQLTEDLQADFEQVQQLEEQLTDEEQEERERLERERRERQRREREAAQERAAEREEARAAEEREQEAAEQEAAEQEAAEQEESEQEESEQEPAGSSEDDDEPSGSSSDDGGSDGGSSASAPSSDGQACPLDQPRNFIDSWGNARSGGRAHRGTDIMGPHGIPVRAITSGTWNIQSPGASAGVWAILHGDDGNHYWYLHLDSHTVGNGARVSAGQQVGTNGSTGNASAGAEHIHFELHPGGGSAVNPYAMLRSVC